MYFGYSTDLRGYFGFVDKDDFTALKRILQSICAKLPLLLIEFECRSCSFGAFWATSGEAERQQELVGKMQI